MKTHAEGEASESIEGTLSVFARRVLLVLALSTGAFVLWTIKSALLLLFAGILLAVPLSKLTEKLAARTPLPRQGALVVVIVLLLTLLGFAGWFFGTKMAGQIGQLREQVQQSLDVMRQYAWGEYLAENLPRFSQLIGRSDTGLFSRITGAASRLIDIVAGVLITLFLGIYLAVKPHFYKRGVLQLLPEARRPRVEEALDTTSSALWYWLLATFVSMTIIGVLSWLGLILLGIPLAAVLGISAGLLEFIPFIGPFIAMVPAVLVGFLQGPTQALYVALLYLAIQQLESYVITPLVQERGPDLPPALTLLAAVVFGLVFGPLGVIVATPLMVALLVLTKMLYVEDVLETPTYVPGRENR